MRRHGCGALVPPGDAAALTEAIAERLDDPARARVEGQRARVAARAKVWEVTEWPKLRRLYAERLERAATPEGCVQATDTP